MAFQLTSTQRRTQTATRQEREPSEFDGIWINVGLTIDVEGEDGKVEQKFVRLPRGIAVADLIDHKVYASSNPDWAEEATMINEAMQALREGGLDLEEGQAVPLKMSVQLYRKQEAVEAAPASVGVKAMKNNLFGG